MILKSKVKVPQANLEASQTANNEDTNMNSEPKSANNSTVAGPDDTVNDTEPVSATAYRYICRFDSNVECSSYIKNLVPTKVAQNHKPKCNMCENRDHHMSVVYRKCKCNHANCPYRLKVEMCDNICILYQKGLHSGPIVVGYNHSGSSRQGVCNIVKDKIRVMIDNDQDITPKAIYMKLQKISKQCHAYSRKRV